MRELRFQFKITCHSEGTANRERVEQLLFLHLQELTNDEEFITALNEQEAVTIELI